MPKIASFPFKFITKTKLGKIYRPYIIVSVYSKQRKAWQPLEMVIDTGADYTLFPKKYAEILGVDLLNECFAETTLGIGGAETVYQHKSLRIKIDNWEKQIPVGFLERNDIPALLGRLDCLEILHLTFKNRKSLIELP